MDGNGSVIFIMCLYLLHTAKRAAPGTISRTRRGQPAQSYRIKFVLWNGSFSGRPYFSFPRAILFIRNVIFLASVRMVCNPSKSCCASPAALPWMLFQYWLDATGIPLMVKYLFSSSNVADSPPRLAETTLAPTFMVLSK